MRITLANTFIESSFYANDVGYIDKKKSVYFPLIYFEVELDQQFEHYQSIDVHW
ncbi:MAG: hypothetical protein QNJ70_17135 [Xenococcaceae cyanobacterium MO_207.B15]|nr:hypothetical protein [Xenococcaceae cyanobacterium MO_207.B15]